MSYEGLDRRARAISAMLRSAGKPGDRALVLLPPGLDFVAAYFGCLYSQFIAIPVNSPHRFRMDRASSRLSGIAADATPSLGLTTSSLFLAIKEQGTPSPELRNIRWLVVDRPDVDSLADNWIPTEIDVEDIAFLQYTSGSTTEPKGVVVSHANIMHNLTLSEKCFGLSSESQAVIWLPPYHDMGLIGGILQPLRNGFPVTLMSPAMFLQRPFRWLQSMSRFRATISGAPNFAYDLCFRKIKPEQREALDLRNWDVAFNGAEPVNHKTVETFSSYFAPCGFRPEAFTACYGLAEATLMVSGGLKRERPLVREFRTSSLVQNHVEPAVGVEGDAQTLVSSGNAIGGQEIKIVDAETLEICDVNEVGEIWVRGPSVASGYWNKPSESDHTFRACLATTNEGPFLRTGDLGFLLEGELFVTGRLKDLIIIDGNNHYPQDIEKTVENSHPAIRPAGCAAFSANKGVGEYLVVIAEVENRFLTETDEIINSIRRSVAEHHDLSVQDIRLVRAGEIAKTTSGKIRRFVVRQNYLSGTREEIPQQ